MHTCTISLGSPCHSKLLLTCHCTRILAPRATTRHDMMASRVPKRIVLASCEKGSKLLVVDLAILVFVKLLNETLDLDGHAKLVLDNMDEAAGVNEASFVCFATKSDEGVESVELIFNLLLTSALLLESAEELCKFNLTCSIFVHISHESKELLFCWCLTDSLQQ